MYVGNKKAPPAAKSQPSTPAQPPSAPAPAAAPSPAKNTAFESSFQSKGPGTMLQTQWARFNGGTELPATGGTGSVEQIGGSEPPPTFADLQAQMPEQTLGPDAESCWNSLTPLQQQQLFDVASVSTGEGDAALSRMMQTPEGQARLLSDASVGGQSLLSCMADIANQNLLGWTADAPIRTDIDTVREDLVNQMLRTIEDPLIITQGNANSCTMASAQVSLVLARPAEYARIMRDLVTQGQAQLAGGRIISLPVDVVPNENPLRRQDDYIFQSALMQEVVRIDTGNPSAIYNPATLDQYDPAKGGQVAMYNQIFGGNPVNWPLDVLTPDMVNPSTSFTGIVLAVYPPDMTMGHAVSVVGVEVENGQTYLIVRNTLPEGTDSALGQDAVGEGETMRIPISSLTDGTYGGYILLATGMTY